MKFMNSVFVKDTSVLGFDTANTIAPANAGEMSWNQADGTLDLRLYNGVTLQAGQELHIYGKASGTVSEGTVVMFAGAQGDHILISAANGSTLRQNPHYIVGIATQTILNGEFGYVTWFGKVHELNTNGWAPGTVLYYDATLNALSATMPTAPDPKVIMAAVLRQHTQEGSILVRPDFGKSLSGLNDVQVSDIQDGQVIAWNATNGRWENTTIEAGGGASTAADVTIADLSGYFTATEVESALAELHQQDLFPSDDSIVWQENQSLDVVVATDAVLGDPIPYNADTLDFHAASYFATASNVYTKSETDSAIASAVAGIVDSSPEALDTLNELAAALGDDANFATTVTNQIAGKADAVHTHDDRYYTESEVNNLLEPKASTGKAIAMAIVFG